MKLTFDLMLEKLRSGEPFTYSRFGDGEWACILGKEGQNCDGHPYTPSLGAALLDVLKKPQRYYLGMHTTDRLKDEIIPFCEEQGIDHEWSPSELFHTAYVEGRMPEFMNVLSRRRKEVMFVGPSRIVSKPSVNHLRRSYYPVPETDAWSKRKHVVQDLRRLSEHSVILFAAGMPACVWIDRLYDPELTLIDIGSALDPFCGVHSRSFHRKHWHQYA